MPALGLNYTPKNNEDDENNAHSKNIYLFTITQCSIYGYVPTTQVGNPI